MSYGAMGSMGNLGNSGNFGQSAIFNPQKGNNQIGGDNPAIKVHGP
jgi:hypothetical protein